MVYKMKGKEKTGYIILAFILIGSFSLLFSMRVESKTRAAVLFDNSAYEKGEQDYKERIKDVLEAHECYNSGLNLTRMVELTGERQYRMEIHNKKFDMLTEGEMEQVREEVKRITIAGPGDCTFSVEVVFSGRDY